MNAEKLKERFIRWIVWKLPETIIYWSAIRMIAYATSGDYGGTPVPELSAMDALKRWEMKHRRRRDE